MKIINSLFGMLLCLGTTTSWAQATLASKQNIPIRLFTYTAGSYTGEVNNAGQPNGYGECNFGDTVRYIGQFSNGLISGEGVTINTNTNNINIAQWRDGQIEGNYFRKQAKGLRLMEQTNGLSHYRRICAFTNAGPLVNICTGSTPEASTVVSFMVAKQELNDATAFLYPKLNESYYGEGPSLQYLSGTRTLSILDLSNGDFVRMEPGSYSFLEDGLKEKLEARINKPMPEWLTGADFWKRDDNGELFFGRAHATELPGGATNVEYSSNTEGTANLRVAKLNRMLEPFGFMQEVHLYYGNTYRYILGNITLSHGATGAHHGTGVVMTCYTDKNDFEIVAGDIQQPENGEKLQYIHSGFSIVCSEGRYSIAIGNWDDQNNIGRGYFFAPGNFVFRGPLKLSVLDGDGDAVKENGIASKVNFTGTTFTNITQAPVFNAIQPPAIFHGSFDLDL